MHALTSTTYTSTAVQSDGKLVAAGYALTDSGQNFVVARYNTDGNLDTTFSLDGKQSENFQNSQANSVAIQSDGKIVVAGDSAIARYNTSGNPDTTFRTHTYGRIFAIAIQTDGKIVTVGTADSDFTIARYNTDGTFDRTFSEDGKQAGSYEGNPDFYSSANSVVIQNDGKIVIAGSSEHPDGHFAIARYNTDGTRDMTFAGNGAIVGYAGDNYARIISHTK